MSFHFRFFTLVASIALGSSACLVEWGDGDFDDSHFDDLDDDGFGSGGAGGSPSDGGGAEGGSDPGTVGEGGGRAACLTEDVDPYGFELCESLPMAPSNMGTCSDGMNAIGYDACVKAYDIFNPRDADHLHSCLSQIPEQDVCSEEPVVDCIDDTYETACVSEDVQPLCESWAQACTSGGDDSFDLDGCITDLNALNTQAADTLHACIADAPEATCGDRYETCLDELLAL